MECRNDGEEDGKVIGERVKIHKLCVWYVQGYLLYFTAAGGGQ